MSYRALILGLRVALVVMLIVGGVPREGWSEEEQDEAPPARPLDIYLFDVSGLTRGLVDSLYSRLISAWSPGLSSEEEPGWHAHGEYSDPIYPLGFGDAEELADLIKQNLPETFRSKEMLRTVQSLGDDQLLLQASPEVWEGVVTYLGLLQRSRTESFALDLVVLDIPSREAVALVDPMTGIVTNPEQLLERAMYQVRASGMASQWVRAESRTLTRYVQDHDVEVTKQASIIDPLVGSWSAGASVRARLQQVGETDHLAVDVEGDIMAPAGGNIHAPQMANKDKARIEHTATRHIKLQYKDVVKAGAWTLAASGPSANLAVFVRASATGLQSIRMAQGELIRPTPPGSPNPTIQRHYPINDLLMQTPRLPAHMGLPGQHWSIDPDIEKLLRPETRALFEPAWLQELLQLSATAMGQKLGETALREPGDRLVLTGPRNLHETMATILATARRFALWRLVAEIDLVDVPAAQAQQALATPRTLDAAARASLLGHDEARVVERARITSPQGVACAQQSGHMRTFIGDYEAEIAEGAAIENPVVEALFEGLQFDLAPAISTGRDGVMLTWRTSYRKQVGERRYAMTPVGPIEIPRLMLDESDGTRFVPFGRTVIASATRTKEGRVRLLLITPHYRPAPGPR